MVPLSLRRNPLRGCHVRRRLLSPCLVAVSDPLPPGFGVEAGVDRILGRDIHLSLYASFQVFPNGVAVLKRSLYVLCQSGHLGLRRAGRQDVRDQPSSPPLFLLRKSSGQSEVDLLYRIGICHRAFDSGQPSAVSLLRIVGGGPIFPVPAGYGLHQPQREIYVREGQALDKTDGTLCHSRHHRTGAFAGSDPAHLRLREQVLAPGRGGERIRLCCLLVRSPGGAGLSGGAGVLRVQSSGGKHLLGKESFQAELRLRWHHSPAFCVPCSSLREGQKEVVLPGTIRSGHNLFHWGTYPHLQALLPPGAPGEKLPRARFDSFPVDLLSCVLVCALPAALVEGNKG